MTATAWTEVPFEAPAAAPANPPASPPPSTPQVTEQARVFIAVPTYNGWVRMEAFRGLMLATSNSRIYHQFNKASLLANGFNRLYATAWNTRRLMPWSHWCLHHADIEAPEFFLDVMLEEMDRVGADVLSCAVAIKDGRALSSTGTVQANGNIRRLTLKEVHRLPETFSAADLPAIGIDTPLVVNTGLMLVRMDRPWSKKVCFRIGDAMREDDNGDLHPIGLPEDWGFSVWANEQGLRLFCTRKLLIRHHGEWSWSNECPADGWETDLGDEPERYEDMEAARATEAQA